MYGILPYNHLGSVMSTARLESRIPKELHLAAKSAAEREGTTLTDFVISALRNAIRASLETSEVIRLGAQAQEKFVQAMLEPPEPSDALRKALERRHKLSPTQE